MLKELAEETSHPGPSLPRSAGAAGTVRGLRTPGVPGSVSIAPPNASPNPLNDDDERRSDPCGISPGADPRWGWHPPAWDARRVGWYVNDKRIRRLRRNEDLKVPLQASQEAPRRHRRRYGAMCPIRPNALLSVTVENCAFLPLEKCAV